MTVTADDRTAVAEALRPFRETPAGSAILCDIDGTLAPIAPRADEAVVPQSARELLARLSSSYGLVACISGRRASEARRLVGIGTIAYAGNHGYEQIPPRAVGPVMSPVLAGHDGDARRFITSLDEHRLRSVQLRIEDKAAIQALHWRGAPDEAEAERHARDIAGSAEREGLVTHWGRKVLEIRPPVRLDKGDAVAELLAERPIAHAMYGGDDRTDLDAFRRLRSLREGGELETALCVGVASPEGPAEVTGEADIVVDGTVGFLSVLRTLAD